MNREALVRPAAPAVTVEPGFAAALDRVAIDGHHAFLRRAWFAGAGGEQPRTLIGTRSGGSVIAALPLVRAGPRLLGLAAIPGSYWPFRCAPIAADADETDLTAMLSCPCARRELGPAWRLGPVLDTDPIAERLLAAARRSGYRVLIRRIATSYALDLIETPWPKPSTLRNLNKQEKKLARLGPIGFRFVSGDQWDSAVLDTLARIEGNAWAGNRSGADPKFVDPALRRGWEAVIGDPTLVEMLSVGILSIGGEPAAFSFGLDCGAVRYCIATSYDARLAGHSPGYLTGYWTYMKSAERGVQRLSLGAGDNGEKRSMGARPEGELIDCLFVRGVVLAAAFGPVWR